MGERDNHSTCLIWYNIKIDVSASHTLERNTNEYTPAQYPSDLR
jgi:hypothetical protein